MGISWNGGGIKDRMQDERNTHEPDLTRGEATLRERLQAAVRAEPVPPFLEARIRARLQEDGSGLRRRPRWFTNWAWAGAVALVLVAGAAVIYELGHLRFTEASHDSYIAQVSHQVATIMRVGLGNHLHCAYFRKYPKTPPPMEVFVRMMGPEYSGLLPIVTRELPRGMKIASAHRCTTQGRRFVHVALEGGSQLMSLVIARKADGESFAVEGILPTLSQSGTPIYRAAAKQFEIASFESRDHLVYLISNLPGQENTNRLLAMTPAVRLLLENLERI